MSSNWPTTWDTFVRTILKAISSSPMISNLSNRAHVSSNSKAKQGEYLNFNTLSDKLTAHKILLVLILLSEGFVDAFCDGLAMEDEAFGDRRLWVKNKNRTSVK